MKRSDVWLTPDNVFKDLCEYWEFEPNLDAAASKENTKCKYFIDEKTNAHNVDWVVFFDEARNNPKSQMTKVWINPPTSQIREYCEDVAFYFNDIPL